MYKTIIKHEANSIYIEREYFSEYCVAGDSEAIKKSHNG